MTEALKADICVLGAGPGGLTVAAAASRLGARTVLVEGHKMGGDCLNYGCIPSKSLIAAASAAAAVRSANAFGLRACLEEIDFPKVMGHVRDVIARVGEHDSQARFESLGATVIRAEGRFTGPHTVEAGGTTISARRFVVATGSRPAVPAIPGIETVQYHTNETLFDLESRPEHLVVVGGGPVGCELAQAYARLGSRVTLVEMETLLSEEDPEFVDVVRAVMARDGVKLLERTHVTRLEADEGPVAVVERDGRSERIQGSHLLLATGRRPTVEGLGLEEAGIEYHPQGIQVDDRLRTTNKRVYALGDVLGRRYFTHNSAYEAGIVVRNTLFRLPARADHRALPRVTYTDPELAHAGMTEAEAARSGRAYRAVTWAFADNDRAWCERRTAGRVKVLIAPRGRVLGASIVGPHAGELLQPWTLAISGALKVGSLAQMIAPYPTLGEINKRVAGGFYEPKLFGASMRRLVRVLGEFG